jgi:hypothetical protein
VPVNRTRHNRQVEGQHGFRPGSSCESHIATFCQDIADFLEERARIDTIIIDVAKAFDLVPYDRLLMKIAASGVDSRVFVRVKEFL